MAENDIATFARQPWVMASSAGSEGHPRKYGSFALRWTRFVRDDHVLTPEQFVHRATGLTAKTFGLKDRDVLKPGNFAEVAVLDPKRYSARADYEHPRLLAEGIRAVVVNGTVAIEDGRPTGALAGRPLRKHVSAPLDCSRQRARKAVSRAKLRRSNSFFRKKVNCE